MWNMHVGRWEGNVTCALGCQTLAKTFHTHTLSLRAYTFTLFAVTCFYTSFKSGGGEKRRKERETGWRKKRRERRTERGKGNDVAGKKPEKRVREGEGWKKEEGGRKLDKKDYKGIVMRLDIKRELEKGLEETKKEKRKRRGGTKRERGKRTEL